VPPGNDVLTHRNLKSSDVILHPSWIGIAPKPLDIFLPKGKLVPDDIGSLIGMVEVEGIPPPVLKLNLNPH
jgi:hypothetical protein